MIARIWHSWTTPANADAYEHLLRTKSLPDIHARRIVGFRGIKRARAVLVRIDSVSKPAKSSKRA